MWVWHGFLSYDPKGTIHKQTNWWTGLHDNEKHLIVKEWTRAFVSFWGQGQYWVWTQGFRLARQALYYLSHTSNWSSMSENTNYRNRAIICKPYIWCNNGTQNI
jgi:hypothetical protein